MTIKTRPLEGRYAPILISALLALTPFILITSAETMFRPRVLQDNGTNPVSLQIVAGLATAGYAFGAFLGGDLISRFRQRRLFLVLQGLFVVGCSLVALSVDITGYAVGLILAGLTTGLMLVTALPPVIRHFPAARMPFTAVFINIAFFGAVTGGPLIGGIVASQQDWRLFYGSLAALGACNFLLAFSALPLDDAPDNQMRFDASAILLGLAATALPFWGASELTAHDFDSPLFWAPMTAGLTAFVALLITEYYKKDALSPIARMWSTFPITGMLAAMIGGGILVTFLLLVVQSQLSISGSAPLTIGLTVSPQIVGTLIAAVVVGWALRTRYMPLTILSGMLILLAAGALLLIHDEGRINLLYFAASGLLGLGAGLTVAPGLFMSGFPLPAVILGRIFALLELVRSVADFVLAPVMVKIARLDSSGAPLTGPGVDHAIMITMVIGALVTLLGVAVYSLGRQGLPRPDLHAWLEQGGVAIHSTPLLAALRSDSRPAG